MNNKETFELGNVVKLKSGGTEMTIYLIDQDFAKCCWFNKDEKIDTNSFPFEAITLIQR